MKEETRQNLSRLIVEELAEKIRTNDTLRRRLEDFTDLPVEKVADAMVKQFEYLLSSELRELIIHLIEQDVALDETQELAPPAILVSAPEPSETLESSVTQEPAGADLETASEPKAEAPPEPAAPEPPPVSSVPEPPAPPEPEPVTVDEQPFDSESIMEHFALKEPFPTDSVTPHFQEGDWFYLYGFCYAPDSSGKGMPTKRLKMKGIDAECDILVMDYGDLRLFASQMHRDRLSLDKSGKPVPPASKAGETKLEHQRILNTLRSEEVIVPMPYWSVIRGHEALLALLERKYVDMLHALIDIHDAVEWEVEIMAFDELILQNPSLAEPARQRGAPRGGRHSTARNAPEPRNNEKVMIRERSLAQEVHNELLLLATKQKIDYMVRLDSAIMGDWKSILSARYTIGKEKRRAFCQAVLALQRKLAEYQLMFKVSNPVSRFALLE